MSYPTQSALACLLFLCAACEPVQKTSPTRPSDTTLPVEEAITSWACHNDLEISCSTTSCEGADPFTPMDVRVDDAGSMSVCAYSGCWEGTGAVTQSDAFLVLTGENLPFSTAPDSTDNRANIVIAIDQADNVAILKAGAFAHPLLCERSDIMP